MQRDHETSTCTAVSWADAILPRAKLGQQGISWSPHSSVLHPDMSPGKHQVEPRQGTSTPAKFPAPRWLPHLHSSLPSLALMGTLLQCRSGARDTPKDTGPNPALALPGCRIMGQRWRRECQGAKAEPRGEDASGSYSDWETARAPQKYHRRTQSPEKG